MDSPPEAKGVSAGETEPPWGVFLAEGPADWQILQQENGSAGFKLGGTWKLREGLGLLGRGGGEVQVRLVHQDTGSPVTPALDWSAADTRADGSWRTELGAIPAGGLYRLETRLNPKGNKLGEWSLRGDMRHFLGVGDIWAVAGQSNATGYGKGPYLDAPEPGVHMLRQRGDWAPATHPLHDSTGTLFPAIRENYNPGHGPFLHFARLLRRELGYPIGLVPGALGGSPLEAWDPAHSSGGPLFLNLKRMADKAGGLRGLLWYQGESDAEPGRAADYRERFLRAVSAWRNALGRAELPILTAQIGRYFSEHPGEEDGEWSQVREAQRLAARQPGIHVVPTLDLPLEDAIHLGSTGNMALGERMARCALGAVYGRPVEWRAPDLLEAAWDGPRRLRLRFAPVTSRLQNLDPAAMPFRVEDGGGAVPVTKAVFHPRDGVLLDLQRAAAGPSRVSCGYGENPPPLPQDAERAMPVLAFHCDLPAPPDGPPA